MDGYVRGKDGTFFEAVGGSGEETDAGAEVSLAAAEFGCRNGLGDTVV